MIVNILKATQVNSAIQKILRARRESFNWFNGFHTPFEFGLKLLLMTRSKISNNLPERGTEESLGKSSGSLVENRLLLRLIRVRFPASNGSSEN